MNIFMLNPPFKEELGKFSRTSRSPTITKGGTCYNPFWLAYAVGYLEKYGYNVKFIDAGADRTPMDDVINNIGFSPDLIVVNTSTPSIYNDVECASKLKDRFKDSFVVLVGTHVSALPEETLNLNKKIDAVARKEYDYTIKELADVIKNNGKLKNVLGLSYRKGKKIHHNQDRPPIKDLDELPFVSQVYKKHLNINNYFFAAAQYPMVMIITGRGCPFRCSFCNYPQTFHGRIYRVRSPENIVDEFEYIVENLPEVKEIGIEDDTFTANKDRVKEFCEIMIERDVKIDWYCNVRSDLDFKTMEIMKKAGCRLLTVGFESASQKILNNIHKGITIRQIREFSENANELGLLVHGCFVIGLPGETKKTLQRSLDLSKELKCDSMQFYPVQIYPGTELYDWAEKNGYITTHDFSKWVTEDGQVNTTMSLPNLSREEMVEFCDKAFREYYIRAEYILSKLKLLITRPREIRRTLMASRVFFANLTKPVGE